MPSNVKPARSKARRSAVFSTPMGTGPSAVATSAMSFP